MNGSRVLVRGIKTEIRRASLLGCEDNVIIDRESSRRQVRICRQKTDRIPIYFHCG